MSMSKMMLHTEGNKILNAAGEQVRLMGVNRAGLEFDAKDAKIVTSVGVACDEWKCNIIRIPLSQDRWFGFAPEQQDDDRDGKKYRALVNEVVEAIAGRGKYVELDLHWNNCNVWGKYIGQHYMPDTNSVLFWRELSRVYGNHPAIIFNVYNEPHDVSWDVWKDGGNVTEKGFDRRTKTAFELKYETPGIQAIVDTIRGEGAKNILIIGGLDWGFILDGIAQGYEIDDRGGNGIIYDSHIYPWKHLEWDKVVTLIADKYPIMIGEFGHYGDDAKPREGAQALPSYEWMPRLMDWIDKNQYNFTAWDFHPGAGPCLIKSFDTDITPFFGKYIKEYLDKNAK